MDDQTLREGIANLFGNFKCGGKEGAQDKWAGHAIDLACEKVEKVENRYVGRGERRDRAKAFGFEVCRQKVLALLREEVKTP